MRQRRWVISRGMPGLVSLALLWSGPSPAQQGPSGDDVLAEARALIEQGRPGEARDRLANLDPTPRTVELLAVAHYHSDEYLRAIELLDGILPSLPAGSVERREAVQILGLSHYLAGHLEDSIPFLEQTRAWASENLELAQVLGRVYIDTHQPAKARAAWARAFGVPVGSAAAHLLTAQMMVRVEREELAESELRQAIDKDPRIPHAHYLLGQMAIFRGRFEEGVELTRRELEIHPGNSMALYQLGDAYVRQRRWDEALAALQKSLWINPFYSGPYILLGNVYMKLRQPATAEEMLRHAIRYDPNNVQAHYLLGQLLGRMGREAEAARELGVAERLRSGER